MRSVVKIVGFGVVNFIARFIVGGVLIMGFKWNPIGLAFGVALTLVALVLAYFLMRFVLKPQTVKEAVAIGVAWVVIALALDLATAGPIVHVPIPYLLGELQTWTRLIVIVLVAPFAVIKRQA